MEKIIDNAKEIGLYNGIYKWKNNRKVSKIIARRKRSNQDGDENEKKMFWKFNVNIIFGDSVGHSSQKGSINTFELN
jgi:hypothetical protein